MKTQTSKIKHICLHFEIINFKYWYTLLTIGNIKKKSLTDVTCVSRKKCNLMCSIIATIIVNFASKFTGKRYGIAFFSFLNTVFMRRISLNILNYTSVENF